MLLTFKTIKHLNPGIWSRLLSEHKISCPCAHPLPITYLILNLDLDLDLNLAYILFL